MSYSLSLEQFVGKVAVVTGASAGIGQAIAETLVKQGVIVAGLARNVQTLKDHAEQLSGETGQLYAFQCDLTKLDEISSTFKKITRELGPISILVNNAGLGHFGNIIDGDIEKWKSILDTNVLALATCTKEAIASMKAHNTKGHVININSVLGHRIIDGPGMSLYPASKFAVTALTETVRLEINRDKLPVKITSVSPGFVKTEFAVKAIREAAPELEKIIESKPGLLSQDVADAVLYVLSTPEHVNVTELTVSVQGEDA